MPGDVTRQADPAGTSGPGPRDLAEITPVTGGPARAWRAGRWGRAGLGSRVTALRLLVVVSFGVVWELVSRLGILDPREFPPFTEVVAGFLRSLTETSTWSAVSSTVAGWAIGMVISIVVGVGLALVIGSSSFLTRSTSLIIDVLRSTPSPAVIFILILVFGAGMTMKVGLVVLAAVFPILIQSMYGVRAMDNVLKDLARSYHISRRLTFLQIKVPAAMPYIATGVRISSSLALIVAVVAEYLGGAPGVGNLVEDVRAVGDFPRMYALILLVGLLSVALNLLTGSAERRLLHWHPTHRKTT